MAPPVPPVPARTEPGPSPPAGPFATPPLVAEPAEVPSGGVPPVGAPPAAVPCWTGASPPGLAPSVPVPLPVPALPAVSVPLPAPVPVPAGEPEPELVVPPLDPVPAAGAGRCRVTGGPGGACVGAGAELPRAAAWRENSAIASAASWNRRMLSDSSSGPRSTSTSICPSTSSDSNAMRVARAGAVTSRLGVPACAAAVGMRRATVSTEGSAEISSVPGSRRPRAADGVARLPPEAARVRWESAPGRW